MGLSDELITPLIVDWLQPVTKQLFHKWGGGCIDSYKAFMVHYDESGDKDLSLHYDNAEVTVNISLNSEYTSGSLQFGGIWGDEEKTEKKTVVEHKVCIRVG